MIETTEPAEFGALTAHDRCDSCGAQALFRAQQPPTANELMFCGHHHRQHSATLSREGWVFSV